MRTATAYSNSIPSGGRHHSPHQGEQHRVGHRRLRPCVLLLHLRAHLHRRWQCHGTKSGHSPSRPRIRAVPPHRDLRGGLSHHRRLQRRRGHLEELRRGGEGLLLLILSAAFVMTKPMNSASWRDTPLLRRILPLAMWSRAR